MTDSGFDAGADVKIHALIKQHAAPKIRLHSFGIGTDASESLIKATADAGQGRYYLIRDTKDILEVVTKSLINTHLDYRTVKRLQITDTTGKVHPFSFNERRVTHGENVEWSTLLDPGVQARDYTWIFEDPNTKKSETYEGKFINVESLALYSECVKQKFEKIKETTTRKDQ
jgi:hypothetical protein